jgi:uncharacterized repeat protein (TIGR03803 family)
MTRYWVRTRRGPLLFADDGYFYGTMSRGGTTDNGTIFRFDPSNAVV